VCGRESSDPVIALGAMTALTESSFPGCQPGRRRKLLTSIAFIDPKPLTRQSIADMLATAFPDNVTIAAASCKELPDTLRGAGDWLHFVVVYIRSAGVTDGRVQEELQLVRLRFPDAQVIMLSDRDDSEEVVKALSLGVCGYIPTSIGCEVAFAALGLIYAGGTYVPAHVFRSATADINSVVETTRSELSDGLGGLTDRELAVLHLLREGKPNKLIASALKIEESTVKVHVRNLLKKLYAGNRTQAAVVANHLLGPQAPTAPDLPGLGLDGAGSGPLKRSRRSGMWMRTPAAGQNARPRL
jgi:DNA-binding NarL/FixJ family response regulator